MKTPSLLTKLAKAERRLTGMLSLLVLLGFHSATTSPAASVNPPDLMTYQGYLADGGGTPLGASAPVNYNVVFRIFDAQSGGNLLWSEVQTVTIDNGQFSVVLGEGAQYQSEARNALSTVFRGVTASDRFMEMTVTIGGNPLTIAPRLRFLPSPYAYLARQANTLVSPNGAELVTTANGQLNINGTIANAGAVANSATTATSASLPNSIVARDAANNFAANQIFLTGTLHALNASVQTIRAHWNAGVHEQGAHLEWNHGGAGETWLLNHKGLGTGGIVFGEVDSARGITERMRIDHTGRLGLGVAAPLGALHVVANASSRVWGTALFTAADISDVTSHVHFGPTGDWYIRSAAASGKIVIQDSGGNVGIGTGNPLNRLSVAGNADFSGNVGIGVVNPATRLDVNGVGQFSGAVQVGNGIGTGLYGDGFNVALRSYNNGVNAGGLFFQGSLADGAPTYMYIAPDGLTGIGTFDVASARLTVGSGPNVIGLIGAYINGSVAGNAVAHGGHKVAIRAGGTIWSENAVIATSDRRIKNIEGASNGEDDLSTLRRIDITNYRYKDVIGMGDGVHKKVIAQQVEDVFPAAVTRQTGIIPDIYQKAIIENGWIKLKTDLKKGERVKLISAKDDAKIHEVLEVKEDRFRVETKFEGPELFVFGREVEDLRAVDYDALSMLNVSATQELAKQVATLQKNEARIAELEKTAAKVGTLERELAELKLLVKRLAQGNQTRAAANQ